MRTRAEFTRLGERVYHRYDVVILLQGNGSAYRVAQICHISSHGRYMVRFWDWAHGRWSGKTDVARDSVICELPGGRRNAESVALSLLAFANMRRAAIEEANRDMRLHVEHLLEQLRGLPDDEYD